MTLTQEQRRQRKNVENDIGELPDVRNPKRRNACGKSFILFCEEYLARSAFYSGIEDTQREIMQRYQDILLNGGKQALAARRSFGKSTITRAAALWALLYGYRKVAVIVGASSTDVSNGIEFFQECLLNNPELKDDFPEVCIPFWKQDGRRNNVPEYHQQRTLCAFKKDSIVFPMMEVWDKKKECFKTVKGTQDRIPYPNSGSYIVLRSIGGTLRGIQHFVRYHRLLRPDIILIDDVQKDATAKSAYQVGNQMEIIHSAIERLAGRDKDGFMVNPSIFYIGTCFQPNDLTSIITNPELEPDYQGVIYKRMRSMPSNMAAWRDYEKVYKSPENMKSKNKLACDFYKKFRDVLDEGAKSESEKTMTPGLHISAIQAAMDAYFQNPRSFWCEDQSDPKAAIEDDNTVLVPAKIIRKVRRLTKDERLTSSRLFVPKETEVLTAFIDVGLHYLNYEVKAFGKDMSFVHTVDYGIFPKQQTLRTTKKRFSVDILDVYRTGSVDKDVAVAAKLMQAINDCLLMLFEGLEYHTENNGAFRRINAETAYIQHATQKQFKMLTVGIDAADFQLREIIWNAVEVFCQDHRQYIGRVIPMAGVASSFTKPMRAFNLRQGEWIRGRQMVSKDHTYRSALAGVGAGDWIENPDLLRSQQEGKREYIPACLCWESNTYRTQNQEHWLLDGTQAGTQTVFDDLPENLQEYAEHQCAEVAKISSYKDGQRFISWRHKPEISDNEFFDTSAGCFALASYVGIENEGETIKMPKIQAPIRMNAAEYARQLGAQKL